MNAQWKVVWRGLRSRHPLDYVLVLAILCAVVVHFSYVWPGMVTMGDGNALRGLPFMLGAVLPAFVTVVVFGLVLLDVGTDGNSFGVPAFCVVGFLLFQYLLLRWPNPLFDSRSPLHINAIEQVVSIAVALPGLFRRYGGVIFSG